MQDRYAKLGGLSDVVKKEMRKKDSILNLKNKPITIKLDSIKKTN